MWNIFSVPDAAIDRQKLGPINQCSSLRPHSNNCTIKSYWYICPLSKGNLNFVKLQLFTYSANFPHNQFLTSTVQSLCSDNLEEKLTVIDTDWFECNPGRIITHLHTSQQPGWKLNFKSFCHLAGCVITGCPNQTKPNQKKDPFGRK